jgi:CDI immunity proteins
MLRSINGGRAGQYYGGGREWRRVERSPRRARGVESRSFIHTQRLRTRYDDYAAVICGNAVSRRSRRTCGSRGDDPRMNEQPGVDDDRSREQIEGAVWGGSACGATDLIATVHRLRRKPIGTLTAEDLRMLIT